MFSPVGITPYCIKHASRLEVSILALILIAVCNYFFEELIDKIKNQNNYISHIVLLMGFPKKKKNHKKNRPFLDPPPPPPSGEFGFYWKIQPVVFLHPISPYRSRTLVTFNTTRFSIPCPIRSTTRSPRNGSPVCESFTSYLLGVIAIFF